MSHTNPEEEQIGFSDLDNSSIQLNEILTRDKHPFHPLHRDIIKVITKDTCMLCAPRYLVV